MSSDSEFVRHIPCDNCGSSDANSLYTDGHTYCFSCNHVTSTDESEAPSEGLVFYFGEHRALRARKISEEVCRKFNVKVDGPHIRFPYTDVAGRVVGYKEKDQEKNFKWRGKNAEKRLFGQQLFGGGKRVVITEGEMDALSVYQAMPKWPVVSIFSGAKGARKDLEHQLTWLMGFEEIVLLFDADEPGQAATLECAQLFPPDKVKIASLGGYKDASEALQAVDGEAIRQAIWNAQSYTPKSIISGAEIYDLLRAPMVGRDCSWPWTGIDTVTGGIRLKELITITAGTGAGKSTLCGELAQHLIAQGFKVGYIALEESVQRTGLRLMTVVANKPLHLDNTLDERDFKRAFDLSVGSGNLYLRDGFGSIDPDVILNDMRYLVKAKGVQFLILDHLSILLSGTYHDDERKMIDVTMTKLRSFVEETGVGLFLISHLRRGRDDKGHEDGAQISMSQLRGSHSISQLSDVVIGLERAVSTGADCARLRVLKNRFNGSTGDAGELIYDKRTGRMQAAEVLPSIDTTDF